MTITRKFPLYDWAQRDTICVMGVALIPSMPQEPNLLRCSDLYARK